MSSKHALRVVRSYEQRIVAPPDEVFPLICPVREVEWLDGFAFEWVFSESGLAEEGAIFTTRHPPEPESVWTITRHDADRRMVEFNRVTPGWHVIHIRVRLEQADGGATAAHITYTFTALGDMGARAITHHHSEAAFNQAMAWWEESMNHYLRTGETLKAHAD